ncbi:MAG: NAD(P)H-quinone oxidoreductase [Gammaproteobacteria bacterium]|nr:NAD(P)H-quinone oxidoreductase [Gammaproteobacteria bacterium]
MKAIQIQGDNLVWADYPEEICAAGQVRIQVRATAINRADLLQRSGGYPPPAGASLIMGLECAGEVIEIGEGVQRVKVGDAVCALLAGGGYAEQVVVAAGQVLPVPQGLDVIQAAALPEVFATAYLNLYMEAALAPTEKVILHAGASGVGTAAIQMLKSSGNNCFVTAGSADKIAQCVALGADAGFDRHQGSFIDTAREWAGKDGVEVILDPVGGQYLQDNLKLLSLNGRLVVIGLMGGAVTEMNLGALMMKRARIIGSTLRARPIPEKAQIMDALLANVWPQIEQGLIKPIVEAQYPIQEVEQAHALMAGNTTVGKVLLTL